MLKQDMISHTYNPNTQMVRKGIQQLKHILSFIVSLKSTCVSWNHVSNEKAA